MRRSRTTPLATLLALVMLTVGALSIAGCPLMMIGRLAKASQSDASESPTPTPAPTSSTMQ